MESDGVFPEGEWDSFGTIFFSDDVNSLPRYLGGFPSSDDYDSGRNSAPTYYDPHSGVGIHGADKRLCHSLDNLTADFNLSKRDYRYSSQPNDISIFIDRNLMGVKKTCSFPQYLTENLEDDDHPALSLDGNMGRRVFENSDYNLAASTAIKSSNEEETLKRKFSGRPLHPQLACNDQVSQHVRRSVITVESPKETYKNVKKNSSKTSFQEVSHGGSEAQSSGSNSTGDETASRDTNGGATWASKTGAALNSGAKTRAARGSATDPQSIYARKRRERINERLRILQKLVPNGTKVDISTMLEEAVHYVKFLQLQIKLLSSDDHWMYAPIAYNGMDIGLRQN